MRKTNLLRGLGCSVMALVLGVHGVAWAADAPGPATIDLKFIESPEGARSWYGFGQDADGMVRRPFGKPGKFLVMKVADGKVRIDTNGDGLVNDKDAPAVQPDKERRSAQVHVSAEVAGKEVKYPLDIQLYEWGAAVGSAAALEGRFGDYTITIQDGNVDGRFGGDGDMVRAQKAGQPAQPLPWSRAIALDRQIYRLEMTGDGAQLKLDPYTGPVAEVTIAVADSFRNVNVTLNESKNVQVAQFSGVETGLLIPGNYRIGGLQGQVGPANQPQHLFAYHDYQTAPIELKPGKNVVKVGPPLEMSFNATLSGLTLDLADVKITGVAGEMYRPNVDAAQGDTFAVYIRSGGKDAELGKLEFG